MKYLCLNIIVQAHCSLNGIGIVFSINSSLQIILESMSCLQVILAIIFPPLAVIDRGCGSMLIVFLLTLCGWVPGVIAALIILNKNN